MNRRLLWIQTMKTKLKCQRKSISLIFMCLYMRTVLICTETLRCCLHRCYLTAEIRWQLQEEVVCMKPATPTAECNLNTLPNEEKLKTYR